MKEPIGFEITIPEGSKPVFLKLSKDTRNFIKKHFSSEKDHNYYIKEFLINKRNFQVINAAFINAMKKAMPACVKTQCLYCTGESMEERDKACYKYYAQMQLTYALAANEFVRLILAHPYIYQNKRALFQVTQDFFRSLIFIKGEGKMYFDLDVICRHILNAGFVSLSEMFAKSDSLNNLKIINNTIDSIEQKKLQNEIYNKEDEDYLDLQRKFFENKQRFYKEQLFIQEREPKSSQKNTQNHKTDTKKTSIPALVLYYYYLQEAKDFPNFDNHPQGKVKAIEELIVKGSINTTAKNFQLEYNKIAHHQSNRVAKSKAKSILFVANELLKNYPNAQKIALQEYKLAINKNR